jgi:hypothetical protein
LFTFFKVMRADKPVENLTTGERPVFGVLDGIAANIAKPPGVDTGDLKSDRRPSSGRYLMSPLRQ